MVTEYWKLWAAIAAVSFMSCVRSSCLPSDRICSRVTKHIFGEKTLFVKRDDENSIGGVQLSISGNKSRKLLCLSRKRPFPTVVASYGGSQSNSMLAIAKVVAASSTQSKFFYFLKPLPKFLKKSPNGNLKAALDLGMQLIEVAPETYDDLVKASKTCDSFPASAVDLLSKEVCKSMLGSTTDATASSADAYWLPQGAAMPEAEVGVEQLVDELRSYIRQSESLSAGHRKPWKVVIASGTGTMALFAARHFALKNLNAPGGISGTETEPLAAQHGQNTNGTNATEYGTIDVEVVAVPCVSSSLHLLDQMRILDLESGSHDIFPTVLRTHRDLQPHSEAGASMNVARNEATKSESVGSSEGVFGEPCKAHYVIWEDLKSAMGMDFDLIYAPRAFELLLESFQHDVEMWRDCNILYYHCGGMEGNESQLGRYRYKNIIER